MIAIEKIVLFIIFLIILIVLTYILVGNIKPSGERINLQNQIRQCCILYRANNCPDNLQNNPISCGGSDLKDLIDKVPMTVYQLQAFCNCPGY